MVEEFKRKDEESILRKQVCIKSINLLTFFFLQAEKHPLHLQHRPGGAHLAHLYSPVPDGPKHLVLCGEPLFQIPLVLPSVLHHEIMSRVWGGEMEERRKRCRLWTMRGACTQSFGLPDEQIKKTKRQGHKEELWGETRSLQRPKTMTISPSLDQTQDLSLRLIIEKTSERLSSSGATFSSAHFLKSYASDDAVLQSSRLLLFILLGLLLFFFFFA